MTKHVILLTDLNHAPAADIAACLRAAGIAITEQPLDGPAVARDHQWLCLIYAIVSETRVEELRKIFRRTSELFPRIPVVGCRIYQTGQLSSNAVTLATDVLKSIGFRAVADTPAQLPALLRQLEDSPPTGELKPLPEFERRPNSAALSLPQAANDDQARGAFMLSASLHLAKNQEEAGRIALMGLARLIAADCWSIYTIERDPRPDVIALQHFISYNSVRDEKLSFDDDWQIRCVAEVESPTRTASKVAHEAATAIDKVEKNENGHPILALPLISEDILLGILEIIRRPDGSCEFSEAEIALLERLAIPIAAALQNSVRISDAERLSHTDDLTQLHNARYLRQFLVNETKRARRYNTNLAAVFLDLDDFKRINDLHGHLVGSHVLMEVASLILPSVRDTDCVVRYGGDEFVVILPETAIDEAHHVAERIRSKLDSRKFSGGRRLKLDLTASFGIAVFSQHAFSPQQLIAAADTAMYEAKASGKNCVRIARSSRLQEHEDGPVHLPTPFLKIPDEKLIS